MRDVIRQHEVIAAERAITLAEAVTAGTAPVFAGKSGLPAYTGFVDRQNDIIQPPAPDSETAAERRLWASLDARVGQ